MKKVKFELNKKGVRELLQSAEMQSVIQQYTKKAEMRANASADGYVGDVQVGKNRAIGMVKVKSKESFKDNLKNNTLLKSIS